MSTSQKPIKKILCPLDFSDYSQETLLESLGLAERLGAQLLFLHVVNEALFRDLERMSGRVALFNGALDTAIDATQEDRAQQLAAMLAENNAERVPHSSRVTVGVPWEKILEVGEEEGIDLIVMGAKGRGAPLRYLRFGSSAEKVFRRAKCRTMFIRGVEDSPAAS